MVKKLTGQHNSDNSDSWKDGWWRNWPGSTILTILIILTIEKMDDEETDRAAQFWQFWQFWQLKRWMMKKLTGQHNPRLHRAALRVICSLHHHLKRYWGTLSCVMWDIIGETGERSRDAKKNILSPPQTQMACSSRESDESVILKKKKRRNVKKKRQNTCKVASQQQLLPHSLVLLDHSSFGLTFKELKVGVHPCGKSHKGMDIFRRFLSHPLTHFLTVL